MKKNLININHYPENINSYNNLEEIKICARLKGIHGFQFGAGYMVFDSSMPEFEEIKHAFLKASQKYLERVGGDIEDHERAIYNELKEKFRGE